MDLDLPASEFAWSAETAYDWHSRHLSCTVHPPKSFLVAVRALMAPDPAPFSQHALVLADLSRLSSFPLLILSRMMSYLEKKAEEALQQIDPFQPIRTLLFTFPLSQFPLPILTILFAERN